MRKLLTFALALGSALGVMAAPARPVPFNHTQPDGSVITLRRLGDERFHFKADALTGMPVVERSGAYYYAEVAADGAVRASKRMVTPTPPAELTDPAAADRVIRAMQAETLAAAESRAGASSNFGLTTSFNGVRRDFTREGDVPCLVILVQFSDTKFTASKTQIEQWLNSESTGDAYPGGSASTYFKKQSRGKFRPAFEVYGTYTASRRAADYVNNVGNLVVTALQSLKSRIDLSRYDLNADGIVDNVYMIFAGEGGHIADNCIWPANEIVNSTIGGYKIRRVAYANEMDGTEMAGIGTFCHEFGHVLGLADLYTLGGNYPSSTVNYWTPTYWDVMDTGCDLCYGCYPPNLSAFERHALGWSEPHEITAPGYYYLASQEADGAGALVRNPSNPDEVVYFEYRDLKGWDQYHCGSGLLVWHVRYNESTWNNNAVNNSSSDPLVKIVAADGKSGNNASNAFYDVILYGKDSYMAGDPFPGTTGKTSFTSTSSPAFLTKAGSKFTLADGTTVPDVTDIAERSLDGQKYMSFAVAGARDTDASRVIVGPDGNTTAIAGIQADQPTLRVATAGRSVTVNGCTSASVEVFDALGRRITYAPVQGGSASLTVPSAGFYMVRSGSAVAKISLR